jgi:hypothetical protein
MRARLAVGSKPRRLFDRVFLPLGVYTDPFGGADDPATDLTPRTGDGGEDDARAEAMAIQARELFAAADLRVESAERRATTLQGTIALATPLLFAGGAFLAGPDGIRDKPWRIALGLLLLLVILCLFATAIRALQATSSIHQFQLPDSKGILERATHSLALGRTQLAVDLLRSYAHNADVADWKVAHLRAATWWLRWALFSLVALSVALTMYLCFGPVR